MYGMVLWKSNKSSGCRFGIFIRSTESRYSKRLVRKNYLRTCLSIYKSVTSKIKYENLLERNLTYLRVSLAS